MLGEGTTLEGPINIFSIAENPVRAVDNMGPRDFFLQLNCYSSKKMIIDQGGDYFPASSMNRVVVGDQWEEQNRFFTNLIHENGGRESFVYLAGDISLLNDLLFVAMPVLNQKAAPGAPANEKFDFSSPWRTIPFERVAVVSQVTMAASPINGGYFVEAVIPWSVLNQVPRTGLKLNGDVGVLFADNGGTQTIARQYWSNKTTGLVNDVPGEADLTPRLWGTFTLK